MLSWGAVSGLDGEALDKSFLTYWHNLYTSFDDMMTSSLWLNDVW